MKNETLTSEQLAALGMSDEILANSQTLNSFLTSSGQVKAVFHTHYVNMEKNLCGIEDLICSILTENDSYFKKNIEATGDRHLAIIGSMFTSDIVKEVQNKFTAGSVRYPAQTIKASLSVFMFKKGKIGKIELSGLEDKTRTSCKPRCKWYLIKD